MEQVMRSLNRAANSNAVINTALVAVFGTLAGRSMVQERTIAALEAEKDSLLKENKVIKTTIWDWKQKLYAEAESNPQNALLSLSTPKSIYGEVVTLPFFKLKKHLMPFLVEMISKTEKHLHRR